MMKKYFALIILFLLAVTGCTTSMNPDTKMDDIQDTQITDNKQDLPSPEDYNYKIALVMKALSNPFFANMEAGAKEYAKANDIPLQVFGVERETDVDEQISIVENLISQGYDAIIIAPADSKRLVPVCKKAIDKGIIVINIDNPFDTKTLEDNKIEIPFVGSNNYEGASMAADYVKTKLGGTGNVLVIEGITGVKNADLRRDGFIETVTKDSEINILTSQSANWHTDEAFALTTDLLNQYPDVDAIFCANDNMALGAIQALEIANLQGKVIVVAYDNIGEARTAILNDKMHATVEQHPELMGAYGLELAAKKLSGQEIPAYKQTPLDLITAEGFNKKIGLSLSDISNPFFESIKQGAEKEAKMFGSQIIVKDAKNDDATQWADIKDLIEQGVDIIIINPTNSETIGPAIDLVKDANIQIITVDRSVNDNTIISHIASDNVAGGKLAAEFIISKINSKGNVLEIEGLPGTSAAKERGSGFNKALSQELDIEITKKVADFDRDKAKILMKQLIQDGNKFDAVFAHNDNMILGVIDALKESGSNIPILVGFDAIKDARTAIKQGELTATIAQKPEQMGKDSVQAAVNALRGEKMDKIVLTPLEIVS